MRKWLYKKNVEATIFTGEQAVQEALDSGWQTRPYSESEAIEAIVITKEEPIVAIEKKEYVEEKKESLFQEDDEEIEDELETLNKDDLLTIAAEEGIIIPSGARKDTLIETIKTSRAAG